MDKSQISLAIKEAVQQHMLGNKQVNEGFGLVLGGLTIGAVIYGYLEKKLADSSARENRIKRDNLMSYYLDKLFDNREYERTSSSLVKSYKLARTIKEIEAINKSILVFIKKLEKIRDGLRTFKMTDAEFSEFNKNEKIVIAFLNKGAIVKKEDTEKLIALELRRIFDKRILDFDNMIKAADSMVDQYYSSNLTNPPKVTGV